MLSYLRKSGAVLLLALSACATPAEPPLPPTTIQLNMKGAPDMNDGAPARVKIYYLNSAEAFQFADFFTVFGEPESALGTDLVAVDEFQLAPGRTVTDIKSFDTPPAAIGVVAAFRDIGSTGFLAVAPIAPNSVNSVQVILTGNIATIQ